MVFIVQRDGVFILVYRSTVMEAWEWWQSRGWSMIRSYTVMEAKQGTIYDTVTSALKTEAPVIGRWSTIIVRKSDMERKEEGGSRQAVFGGRD